MNPTTVKLALPHSLVLVLDPIFGEIPASLSGELITATNSCLAIGTRPEMDGETELVLGNSESIDQEERPAFKGILRTPSHKIAICSALNVTLIEMLVPSIETVVRVWVNDSTEPDRIIIGIG